MQTDRPDSIGPDRSPRVGIWVVKWLLARRTLSRFNLASAVQAASFIVLLGIFTAVCFIGIKQLCVTLLNIEVIGPLILKRSFSLGLLTLFIMIGLSQLVASYAHLYRSRELPLLHHAPLTSREVFSPQATETMLKGCWMPALCILAILVAYGRGREAPWLYYVFSLTGVLPFLAIASGLGMLSMMLLAWMVIGRQYRERILGVVSVLLFCLVLWWGRSAASWVSPGSEGETLGKRLGESLANLRISTNRYLPNFWLSELVEASIEERMMDLVLPLALLVSTAWLLLVFIWFLGDRTYRSAWLSCLDRGFVRRSRVYTGKLWLGFPLSLLPSWFRSLLVKEWFIFRRDFSQWGQFLLLMALVLLYVVQIRDIHVEEQGFRMRSIIAFFNILLLGFIQATLALRYAFPSVSLEGISFWTVCKSPVGTRRYFWGKYLCHFLWILMVGETMILLLNQILYLEQPFSSLAMIVVATLSLGFTSCTVGLGALYPRFDAPSSADVSSGVGALVSMVLTLSYLAFSAAILARMLMNILPPQGPSILDGHGLGGLLILAGGVFCSWLRILLPQAMENWVLNHFPLEDLWWIFDASTAILVAVFILLQGVTIVFPARAGMRRLEDLTL
ncbi:MAG: hypothetical protein ABIH23_21125 [bacterium]